MGGPRFWGHVITNGGDQPQSPSAATSARGATPFERSEAGKLPVGSEPLLDRVTHQQFDALAPQRQSLYGDADELTGMRQLRVATAPEPTGPTSLPAGTATAMRTQAVERALLTLGVADEHQGKASSWLLRQVEVVVGEDGQPVAVFPGRDGHPCSTIGEALAHWKDTDRAQQLAKWLPPEAPPELSAEEAAIADSAPFRPDNTPRNVIVTSEQALDFAAYAEADRLAKSRGGQVLIDDTAHPSKPEPATRHWQPGVDVPVTFLDTLDMTRYAEAQRVATAQGGRVVQTTTEADHNPEEVEDVRRSALRNFKRDGNTAQWG